MASSMTLTPKALSFAVAKRILMKMVGSVTDILVSRKLAILTTDFNAGSLTTYLLSAFVMEVIYAITGFLMNAYVISKGNIEARDIITQRLGQCERYWVEYELKDRNEEIWKYFNHILATMGRS